MNRYKHYIKIVTLAFFLNAGFLYAFPIIEFLKNLKQNTEVLTKKDMNIGIIKINKPEDQKKKKQPPKAMELKKSEAQVKTNRFKMDFGAGSGSGASLGSASKGVEGIVYKEGEVDQEPVIIRKVTPSVPMEAQNAGVSGRVVIKIVISETGEVIQSSYYSGDEGYGFKESAMEALRGWQFKPAMFKGAPVKFEYLVPFSF